MNKKTTLALLFGGRGYESDVSVMSAKYLLSQLDTTKYTPLLVYITKSGEWKLKPEEESIDSLIEKSREALSVAPAYVGGRRGLLSPTGFFEIDVAFPMLHGDFGEDGVIQGALENAKIPFVGQNTKIGALVSDKAYTKVIAEYLGIPTAKWTFGAKESKIYTKDRAKDEVSSRLSYPLFVKPTSLGSSVGASVALSDEGFDSSYDLAASLGDGRVLIEEYAEIERELECAYFSAKSKELFTNIGEISYNTEFYDYDTKYSSDSAARIKTSTDISEEIKSRILEYSKKLVSFFELRDLSRIDFFLTKDGRLLFNEINTMPGFTKGSLYPRLLSEAGINSKELISALIESALQRGA